MKTMETKNPTVEEITKETAQEEKNAKAVEPDIEKEVAEAVRKIAKEHGPRYSVKLEPTIDDKASAKVIYLSPSDSKEITVATVTMDIHDKEPSVTLTDDGKNLEAAMKLEQEKASKEPDKKTPEPEKAAEKASKEPDKKTPEPEKAAESENTVKPGDIKRAVAKARAFIKARGLSGIAEPETVYGKESAAVRVRIKEEQYHGRPIVATWNITPEERNPKGIIHKENLDIAHDLKLYNKQKKTSEEPDKTEENSDRYSPTEDANAHGYAREDIEELADYEAACDEKDATKKRVNELRKEYVETVNNARKNGLEAETAERLTKLAGDIEKETNHYKDCVEKVGATKENAIKLGKEEVGYHHGRAQEFLRACVLNGMSLMRKLKSLTEEKTEKFSKYDVKRSTELLRNSMYARTNELYSNYNEQRNALKREIIAKEKLVKKAQKPTLGDKIYGLFSSKPVYKNHLSAAEKEQLEKINKNIETIYGNMDNIRSEYNMTVESIKKIETLQETKEVSKPTVLDSLMREAGIEGFEKGDNMEENKLRAENKAMDKAFANLDNHKKGGFDKKEFGKKFNEKVAKAAAAAAKEASKQVDEASRSDDEER